MNNINADVYILGIDATNLRRGGGVTHLAELLSAANPQNYGFVRVILWGGKESLERIEDHPWLIKQSFWASEKGFLLRMFWQVFFLSRAARRESCNVIFVPGGSFATNFRPVITMSQNLLPFEFFELFRYGWSLLTLKLLLLRFTQSRSFRKANGVIFLTAYARSTVSKIIGNFRGQTSIIPHGLSSRFYACPKLQKDIVTYSQKRPYRILYVSTVDLYKHQWHVVEAVSILRKRGLPITLSLIGPAYPPALKRLNKKIYELDRDKQWVHYHGSVPFTLLHNQYLEADLGLFASSCENMPNILLELMASGLPIACSKKGPMVEILGDSGVYFDPEQPKEISDVVFELIQSVPLRSKLAQSSHTRARSYSWQRCANDTFAFLREIVQTIDRK